MLLDNLPTEIILHIFRSAPTLSTVLALASTDRRLYRIYSGSQKLPILFSAAERQYGPLRDAIQLVTHNASQSAHIQRSVPHSRALLKQLLAVGTVAQRWATLCPLHRWRRDFENRRALRPDEARRLRRAVYRLWLYSRAFHNSSHQRSARLRPDTVRERAALLHGWNNAELVELEDVRDMLRNVLRWRVCPSNGTVLRRYRRRFNKRAGDEDDSADDDDGGEWWMRGHDYGGRNKSVMKLDQPLFHPPTRAATWHTTHFHSTPTAAATFRHHPAQPAVHEWSYFGLNSKPDVMMMAAEGWGDEVPHYYVLEDMLKLDPGQILWLRDHAPGNKPLVESYVKNLGEWFENNGETFGQTLADVLAERGEELGELRESLEGRGCGVVVEEQLGQ